MEFHRLRLETASAFAVPSSQGELYLPNKCP